MARQRKRTSFLSSVEHANKGVGLLLLLLASPATNAKVWGYTLSPYITASQFYSDNLTLGQGSALLSGNKPQGGFVTELAPTLNVRRQGPNNSNFNLSYRLQFLGYEGVSIDPKVFHQLQMSSRTAIYENSVYVDSASTMGQAIASSIGAFAANNVFNSASGNYTTYRTFSISPYWVPHLGGYADGNVRVGYNYFANDTASSANPANSIGNLGSHSFQQSVFLRNGSRFDSTGATWRLSFYNQEYNYQQANLSSVRFRNTNGELSYRLINDVSAFVQAGYYNNDFPTNTATNTSVATNNGAFVTPGLSWTPSPKLSLAAGYGVNSYFSNLMWRPSQRTSVYINYRNSKVGGQNYGVPGGFGVGFGGFGAQTGYTTGSTPGSDLGTSGSSYPTGQLGAGNAGSNWNVNLQHRTRTTTWNAGYFTTNTTIQQYLGSQATFTTPTDINGNPIGEPTANSRATNLPNLTNPANDVILTKRAHASVSWYLSKSTFMLSPFYNNISYSSVSSSRPQNIYGVSGTWNWRFTTRTSASLTGSWQTSEYRVNGSAAGNEKTDFINASLMINRQINPNLNAYLQFSHFQTNSSNVFSILNTLGSYDTNLVNASINFKF